MTVEEAAKVLGMTTRSIMRLLSHDQLHGVKEKIPVKRTILLNIWNIDDDEVYDIKMRKEKKEPINDIR